MSLRWGPVWHKALFASDGSLLSDCFRQLGEGLLHDSH